MDQLLLLPCPRVLACSWWGPAAAIPQASLQRFAAARTVGKSQVPGSVALATTSRRVSRPSFCGGERCCRCRWCCCPALLDFSCVGRLGTLAAAASPQTKPPAGVVAAMAAHQHQRETANPATPPRPSGDLGGRRWLLSVCWRGAASAGSRRAFPRPKWAGNGTQITYVRHISRVEMVLAMKTKGIGYVRVSTDQQAEHGVSLEAQVEKIRAMATVHDVELLDVLVDAGESAKDLDRPRMVRILERVQSRAVGMVIVAKLDRLTRSSLATM